MRYFLIDTENVGAEWFPILEKSTDNDVFYLFHTPSSAKFSYQYLELIVQNFSKLVQIPCRHGMRVGDSALDFQICTYLGYMIGQNSDTEKEDEYYIVAKDHDYDNVVSFWRFRGYENVSRLNPNKPEAVRSIEENCANNKLTLRQCLAHEESEDQPQDFSELCAEMLGYEKPLMELIDDDDDDNPFLDIKEKGDSIKAIPMPFYNSKEDSGTGPFSVSEKGVAIGETYEFNPEEIPNILDEQIPEPAFSAACETLLNKTANRKKKASEQRKKPVSEQKKVKSKKVPVRDFQKDILVSALGAGNAKDPSVGNVENILKQHQYKDLQKIYLDLIKHMGQKKGLATYQKIKPHLKEYYGQGK